MAGNVSFSVSASRTPVILRKDFFYYVSGLQKPVTDNWLRTQINSIEGWFNHRRFVVYEDEYKIYYFVCSSRFYNTLFTQEIESIITFLQTNWKHSLIEPFLKKNLSVKKMVEKYNPCISKHRDALYLLNKNDYWLETESILDLYALNAVPKKVMEKLQQDWNIICETMNWIRPMDLYLIAHIIHSLLKEYPITPAHSDILEKLYQMHCNKY